jgi:hypothetical protein
MLKEVIVFLADPVRECKRSSNGCTRLIPQSTTYNVGVSGRRGWRRRRGRRLTSDEMLNFCSFVGEKEELGKLIRKASKETFVFKRNNVSWFGWRICASLSNASGKGRRRA